jgi:hypothetical protein
MVIFAEHNARICSIIFSLCLARLGGNLKLFVENDKGGFLVFADLCAGPGPLAIRSTDPTGLGLEFNNARTASISLPSIAFPLG